MNLRKYAEGRPCFIRVPEHCNGDPLTVCLCHLRIIGISGIGLKSPDLLGAYGCTGCHAYVDGNHEDSRLYLLEGMARTQAYLIERNLVKW